tara:strand:- start:4696 stop:4983 length:288 start_codon:yes stop_codon:yes gene_type:complete
VKMARKTRLFFDFSADSLERLDEIVAHEKAPSRATVVRNALALYDQARDAYVEGGQATIRYRNGKIEFFSDSSPNHPKPDTFPPLYLVTPEQDDD